jgi:hypothetical protein
MLLCDIKNILNNLEILQFGKAIKIRFTKF